MQDYFKEHSHNLIKYDGIFNNLFHYIEDIQLLRTDLWCRFVQQFKEDADYEGGWRGEFWGKMMRGACFVYSYTQNPQLYTVLHETILDILSAQEENGRISSYGIFHEFEAWDIWGRKYVLLGMQYFLEICKDDELSKRITDSMCRQVDYIMLHIGDPNDGKILITKATRHWRGLNSSSILEPIVRLYNITKEQKYLDFATYIVECGGIDNVNIFELAYEDVLYPYQYPVTKAYEMISCFEGLLEYYRVTKIKKYKTCVVNFANKILESDFTIIGCCGCTHELFDHSTVRQANTTNGRIIQETCVTVTIMKFLYQLTLLTGDSKYVDAFEISLYNAYLGSINTENAIHPSILAEHPDWNAESLPFDSYSPLTAGIRGNGIGGLRVMSDNHYYGCCACIGAAGIGLVPKMGFLTNCVTTVFEYDSANRLLKAGGNAYTYNAEDVRIRNLCGSDETIYTYNTQSRLSQLLMKTTNGVVTKYVYGLGLIGEEKQGCFKTYHFDYRGSIGAYDHWYIRPNTLALAAAVAYVAYPVVVPAIPALLPILEKVGK